MRLRLSLCFALLAALALLSLLSACGGRADGNRSEPQAPAQEPQAPSPEPPLPKRPGAPIATGLDATIIPPAFLAIGDWTTHLGEGFDWSTPQFIGRCVTGETPLTPVHHFGAGDFGGADERTLVHFELELDGPSFCGDPTIALASLDPRFQAFIKGAVADDSSLTEFSAIVYTPAYVRFGDDASRTNDPSCVSSDFVNGADYGARILYGLKVSFHDKQLREKFISTHLASFRYLLMGSGRAALSKELQGNATIQLQMLQIGGTSSKEVADLLAQSTCRIGDLDACEATMEALQTYSNNFGKQLALGTDGEPASLQGLVPIRLTTRPLSAVPATN